MSDRADLLQGTLDLLILKSLLLAPLHGWGISKRIRELSRDVLQVNQGSLYPALYRLEDRGWVESEWGISPEGRRAKFYTLTSAGRAQIATEQDSWRRCWRVAGSGETGDGRRETGDGAALSFRAQRRKARRRSIAIIPAERPHFRDDGDSSPPACGLRSE